MTSDFWSLNSFSVAHTTIKVATYNIHKCKGIDGRVSPDRIVSVLKEIDADVIALQEVVSRRDNTKTAHQARFIADSLMMNCVSGPNIVNDSYEYGNIILTRLPISMHVNHNISVSYREPRGCLQVDLQVGSTILHFFNAHFGTAYLERVRQARALSTSGVIAGERINGPRVLVGDFNDWFPGRASRLLRNELLDISKGLGGWRKQTHPCLLPIFKLDKIFVEPTLKLKHSYVHRSKLARIASDHLPLVAQLDVPVQKNIMYNDGAIGMMGQNMLQSDNDIKLQS